MGFKSCLYSRVRLRGCLMRSRSWIVTAAMLNVGETIASTAVIAAQVKPGYEDVHQCSGLVRMAYVNAGICLDNFDGSFSCKDNLVDRYGIGPYENGVAFHYHLANFLKQNSSVRKTNDPLVGDIVFFSNTSGPGHPLNHEGIVVAGPISDGTVEFVHATAKKGVFKSRMNIIKVLDDPRPGTDFLGSFCDVGKGVPDCLAGSLFDGYGTIRDPKTLTKN